MSCAAQQAIPQKIASQNAILFSLSLNISQTTRYNIKMILALIFSSSKSCIAAISTLDPQSTLEQEALRVPRQHYPLAQSPQSKWSSNLPTSRSAPDLPTSLSALNTPQAPPSLSTLQSRRPCEQLLAVTRSPLRPSSAAARKSSKLSGIFL